MSKSCFLGLDVGTSGVKALLVDAEGQVLGRSHRGYGLSASQDGRIEQDPLEWLDAIVGTVREASTESSPGDILSLSVSAQGGTMVPVSRTGEPLARAVSWLDRSAVAQAKLLQDNIGNGEVFRLTGWPVAPNNTAVQIAAYRARSPVDYAKAAYFLDTASFVNMWLTGSPAMDTNVAGISQLANATTGKWEPAILSTLEIDDSRLPTLINPGRRIANLTKDASEALGLSASTAVVSGAQDQYCAALGAGLRDPGSMLVSTGTAWVVLALSDRPYPNAIDGFGNGRHLVHDLWGHFGEVSNGGTSLEWIRTALSGTDPMPFDDLNKLAGSVPPGAHGARFYPYFNGTDPRANGSESQATFRGLRLSHGPGELVRSVMEGVAFETVLLINRYEKAIGRSLAPTLVGGATKSEIWTMILADALGRDLRLSPVTNAACLGAALLARRGLEPKRAWSELIATMVPKPTIIRYDRENNEAYSQILESYMKDDLSLARGKA